MSQSIIWVTRTINWEMLNQEWSEKWRGGEPAMWRMGFIVLGAHQREVCTFPRSWCLTGCLWGQQPPTNHGNNSLCLFMAPACGFWLVRRRRRVCVGWVWTHLEPTVCRRTILQQRCTMGRHHWKAARTANGRGEKNIAKGRGKGEIPLVSKATPAYSIIWPHKTLFSRQKNPLLYLHEIITKCQALHTVLCVKRGFKESQIHLSSTIHIAKITTVETKQTECLCSLVLQPQPTDVRTAFSYSSVGLEMCPRVVKPEPELVLRTRGFNTNKSEF